MTYHFSLSLYLPSFLPCIRPLYFRSFISSIFSSSYLSSFLFLPLFFFLFFLLFFFFLPLFLFLFFLLFFFFSFFYFSYFLLFQTNFIQFFVLLHILLTFFLLLFQTIFSPSSDFFIFFSIPSGPKPTSAKKIVLPTSLSTGSSNVPDHPPFDDSNTILVDRWIIQPYSTVQMKIRFRSENEGKSEAALAFEVVGTGQSVTLLCQVFYHIKLYSLLLCNLKCFFSNDYFPISVFFFYFFITITLFYFFFTLKIPFRLFIFFLCVFLIDFYL